MRWIDRAPAGTDGGVHVRMVTRAERCHTVNMWSPDAYLAFADERGRPFFELLARVGADAPRRVVDLGCGPGNLTAALATALAGRDDRGA